MNNKGQMGFFFLVMIGITLFILAMAFAPVITTNTTQVRSNMDCNNVSIDTSQKVVCTIIDISSPFFIGIILAMGGIILGAKLLIAGA